MQCPYNTSNAVRRAFAAGMAVLAVILASGIATAQAPLGANPFAQGPPTMNGSGTSGADIVFVTNAEFKRFRPTLKFDPKEAGAAALMSPREGGDYTAFVGKRLGKDFYWKRAPEKESGYLMVGMPGIGLETLPPIQWPPAAPTGMVYVPERPFIMGNDKGDDDEKPKHLAATGPYFIDKLEVGNAEFKAVFPAFEFPAGQEDSPAIVNWQQAADYAAKIQKRLPTEAEWEKAARGWDGRTFPWGETFDPSLVCADDKTPRGGATASSASPYGCLDMAGGAWEWTADWYKPYPNNDSPDDDYGETFKVLRGGSTGVDIAALRTSLRLYLPLNTTGGYRTGFRCAKDIE